MNIKLEASWKSALGDEFEKNYFQELSSRVRERYLHSTVYPPPRLLFNAFALCPFDKVKVVILGQDPYHGPGQAMGLSFSVPDEVRTPPSLKNIYKEIEGDIGTPVPESGNLERWAKQGVLLLNATLTVKKKQANSHEGLGWGEFTNAVIKKISDDRDHVVFMLWGRFAQQKGASVDRSRHLVLEAAHPSPFAAHKGFFGCKHFSKANEYLKKHGKDPVEW